jgi:acyl-CoA thioesterase-1
MTQPILRSALAGLDIAGLCLRALVRVREAARLGLLLAAAMSMLTVPQPGFAAAPPVVLIVGDSLSAEYGLTRGSGWVGLLERELKTRPKLAQLRIVNASISGETTAGGASRIDALVDQHRPTVLVIELGGNDALRGLPLSASEANLRKMVAAGKRVGAKVLLLGMQIPPNYGPDYAQRFVALFQRVAEAEKIALLPFFLAGVADRPDAADYFQADRIHPNEKAQPLMMRNVLPLLLPLLPG